MQTAEMKYFPTILALQPEVGDSETLYRKKWGYPHLSTHVFGTTRILPFPVFRKGVREKEKRKRRKRDKETERQKGREKERKRK